MIKQNQQCKVILKHDCCEQNSKRNHPFYPVPKRKKRLTIMIDSDFRVNSVIESASAKLIEKIT